MGDAAIIDRCRYGGTSVWLARGVLGGTSARRLADRIHYHFRSEGAELLLDVRGLEALDSAGVGALARCRDAHPGFHVVGRPLGWPGLPLGLRLGVDEVVSSPDLASALESVPVATPTGAEARRHPRVPVGIPVEIILGGRTAPATLEELGRGGLRLGGLSGASAAAVAVVPHPIFDVVGLDADPYAREVLGPAAAGPVPAVPVYLLAGTRVGARFVEPRPPV